jgi:DNA-binding ferritin-like protein (Dps family)
MNAKQLIALNNENRKALNSENEHDYDDMLIYIRLHSGKSEQQTEEILVELLDHLLQAQAEGRTAMDVFGEDLEAYCKELIEEIPKETRKKQIRFSIFIILQFFGIISLTSGIIRTGMYYFFNTGSKMTTFSIGTATINAIIAIGILYISIATIFKWLKSTLFKRRPKRTKWLEFLQIWGICMLQIGLFVAVLYFMPEFGAIFSIPTASLILVGIILYLISYLFKKKTWS